ncbi:hypothetical protein [Helicobacter salomonis]|uniref:hypothetical protein n=1 Tax=Helicobacter salomonis TaxID=56878 RepID=UPI000CF185C6|nr:hypothetical protein [Helicobacter salomonis]
MEYRALVDAQVGTKSYKAGQAVRLPKDVHPDYVEYLCTAKLIEALPSLEAYPCVDYHDDTYLCGGKRLVRERGPK